MRQIATLALLGCVVGCSSTTHLSSPPAVIPPTLVRPVTLGANDGFHGPLPAAVLALYCASGQTRYIRTPHLSGETLDAFLASVALCPFVRVHALVEGQDVGLAVELAKRPIDKLEIGNELELPPLELTPQQYAAYQGQACEAVRAVKPTLEIILGGVYTLDDDTKARIIAGLKACPGASVGVHLYEDLTQADVDWLIGLHVPIVVSEFGSHTNCDPAKEAEQKAWLEGRLRLFSTVPNITLAEIYQRPNGSTCDNLATFGFEGKPAESIITGGSP